MSVFDRFLRKPFRDQAHSLYAAAIRQARLPDFYERLGVPDTVDGRFDMVCLHAFLVMHRLESVAEAAPLGQAFMDLMFADMDQNLRELGVGDMGIGRRIKAMAQAFNGRAVAYRQGLDAADPAVLVDALARNLYRKAEPAHAATAAGYLRAQAAHLAGQPDADLLAGRITFQPLA